MAESVEHDKAAKDLRRAWTLVAQPQSAIPQEMAERLTAILSSKAVAFKYVLITGLLGKLTNPTIQPRVLQVQPAFWA